LLDYQKNAAIKTVCSRILAVYLINFNVLFILSNWMKATTQKQSRKVTQYIFVPTCWKIGGHKKIIPPLSNPRRRPWAQPEAGRKSPMGFTDKACMVDRDRIPYIYRTLLTDMTTQDSSTFIGEASMQWVCGTRYNCNWSCYSIRHHFQKVDWRCLWCTK
jgi:hypothetical protein